MMLSPHMLLPLASSQLSSCCKAAAIRAGVTRRTRRLKSNPIKDFVTYLPEPGDVCCEPCYLMLAGNGFPSLLALDGCALTSVEELHELMSKPSPHNDRILENTASWKLVAAAKERGEECICEGCESPLVSAKIHDGNISRAQPAPNPYPRVDGAAGFTLCETHYVKLVCKWSQLPAEFIKPGLTRQAFLTMLRTKEGGKNYAGDAFQGVDANLAVADLTIVNLTDRERALRNAPKPLVCRLCDGPLDEKKKLGEDGHAALCLVSMQKLLPKLARTVYCHNHRMRLNAIAGATGGKFAEFWKRNPVKELKELSADEILEVLKQAIKLN